MKKEIELKFFVDDLAPVRKKLKKLGAKLEWAGREENWFFDNGSRMLRKRDSALRIKQMGDVRLTLKEGRHVERGAKIAHEYQVTVDEPQILKSILERLGFPMVLRYSKNREHWKLGNAYIELDNLNSRRFVEIEAPHSVLRSLAKKLNLDFAKSTTKSYTQLLEEHKNKPR